MVSLLLVSAIAVVSYFALTHEKKSLVEERLLRGKALVRNLATASAEAILSDNELNLFSYCKDIVTNEADALEVYVTRPDGRYIAHSRPELVGKMCSTSECPAILSSTEITIQSLENESGVSLCISSPMSVLDKKIGFVTVILSNESIRKKIDEVRKDLITLAAVAVIVGMLLTFLLAHFLVIPIKKLEKGASIIGTGDFAHRISIKSNNEIGELASTFNGMAESLLRSKEQLNSLNTTSREINTTTERNEVVGKAMDAVVNILRPQQVLFCLHDAGGLRIAASDGFDDTCNLAGYPVFLHDTVIQAALKGRVLVVSSLDIVLGDGNQTRVNLSDTDECQKMIMPVIYERSLKGFFVVNGKKDSTQFTATDKEYLEIISSSAAIALINIELLAETAEKARMQGELEMAETVQKTLFPDEPVESEAVDVYGYFKSASETGGDWYYTLFDKYSQILNVFIGDVTGHGVPAALNTATAYSFIRTVNLLKQNMLAGMAKMQTLNQADSILSKQIYGLLNPGFVLKLLNNILMKKSEKPFLMTFFSSLIDLRTRKLYYANAGHEMPLVYRAQTGVLEPLVSSGVRLGDSPNAIFEQKCIQLGSGDTIVWYTDGVIEAVDENGKEYGERKLYRCVRKAGVLGSAKDALDYCIQDFQQFVKDTPLIDDVTFVVARIK